MQLLQCVWQHHLHIHAAIKPLHCDLHPRVAKHQGRTDSTPKRPQPHPPHRGEPFHCRLQPLDTEKHKVSCSGFLPKTNQSPCKNHAAITMRLAAPPTHPCRHYNAICIHALQNSKGEPIRPPKRLQPHPPHTGGTFHRRLQPLDTEKHNVSCSGFLPKTHPMQHEYGHYNAFCSTTYIHADITMRFASTRCRTPREIRFDPENPRNDRRRTCRTAEENPHCRLQPLCTEKHNVSCSGFLPKTKPMQQSCSYYNAFGSTTYTSMQPLSHYIAICTHTLQNTKGEPIRPRNDRSRTRRTEEKPFIAGCSHLTRKNTRFRAPASSPKHTPCNMNAAITMRFASSRV